MEIKNKLIELIKNLNYEVKDSYELELILKQKLTKKELKILRAISFGEELEDLKVKLNIDDNRLEEINSKLLKKINSENFKQEIYKKPLKEL